MKPTPSPSNPDVATRGVPADVAGALAELVERLHPGGEEGPGGFYARCAAALGPEAEALIARFDATAPPPLARHFDGPGAVRTAAAALEMAERHRPPRG